MQPDRHTEILLMTAGSLFSAVNMNTVGTVSGILTIVYVLLKIYLLLKREWNDRKGPPTEDED